MTNNAVTTLQQYGRGGAIASSAAIAALLAFAAAAEAAPLEELQYDAQQEQVSFVLPDGVMPRSFLMAQPARIVIDIPDTQVDGVPGEQTFNTAVKRLAVTQVEPQLARLVLEISPQATFARGQVNLQNVGDAAPGKDRWVAKLLLAKRPGGAAPAPLAERAAQPLPSAAATPPLPSSPIGAKPIAAKPITAKPAPAVEVPPGMESVVGTLPTQPIAAAPAPMQTISPAPAASSAPVTSPAPATRPTPAVVAPVPLPKLDPVPKPAIAPIVPPAPGSVPIARLPEMPTVPNVPPAPPLMGSIVDRPVGNSPAALVTPTPVLRPDLRPTSPSGLPGQPTVSVPPLASLNGNMPSNASSNNASISAGSTGASLLPNLPPAPPLLGSAMPPAPGSSIPSLGVPSSTLPSSPIAVAPPQSNELPPLPQVSPRDGIVAAPIAVAPIGAPQGLPVQALPVQAALPTIQPQPAAQPAAAPQVGVLPFGSQLPGRSPIVTSANLPGNSPAAPASGQIPVAQASGGQAVVALDNLSTGGVMLSAGTTLSLRYDQSKAMKLNVGQRQQTLLSLLSPIVDSRGRVVVAQGSVVLGEFATGAEGSQFTSQALSLPNRSLSLAAQSPLLPASKQISNDRLLQNSGIGALAGALLGGLNGSVLGGAAAGAAVTYAISPKQTIVQPGQTFQVQLTQNFFATP